MDWHFMASYNQSLASALGLPLYFSWLEGGFEGEMLKQNAYSRPHKVETPNGLITLERDTSRVPQPPACDFRNNQPVSKQDGVALH